MKRAVLSLVVFTAVFLAGIIAVAQQEVAPDHFDGHDYQVQSLTKSRARTARWSRSAKFHSRRQLAVQSRRYSAGKKKMRARQAMPEPTAQRQSESGKE